MNLCKTLLRRGHNGSRKRSAPDSILGPAPTLFPFPFDDTRRKPAAARDSNDKASVTPFCGAQDSAGVLACHPDQMPRAHDGANTNDSHRRAERGVLEQPAQHHHGSQTERNSHLLGCFALP